MYLVFLYLSSVLFITDSFYDLSCLFHFFLLFSNPFLNKNFYFLGRLQSCRRATSPWRRRKRRRRRSWTTTPSAGTYSSSLPRTPGSPVPSVSHVSKPIRTSSWPCVFCSIRRPQSAFLCNSHIYSSAPQ